MKLQKHHLLILLLSSSALLAACSQKTTVALPQGEQSVTGILKPLAFSLHRRGTHVLLQQGSPLYDVESATVNLGAHEGERVTLTGGIEPNTDASALPVLVVRNVIIASGSTVYRPASFPLLRIAFDIPADWHARIEDEFAQFTASDSLEPLLTLFLQPIAGSDFDTGTAAHATVTRTPLAIGSKRAIRAIDAVTAAETISIDRGVDPSIPPEKRVITLVFVPFPPSDETMAEIQAHIEHSLRAGGEFSSSSASVTWKQSSSSTNNSGGQPCGGAAGILCPPGFYCAVTDPKNSIGVCRAY
ncbi:hypothetical protein HY285_02710 [Candidatus Peregrinibacteria bacterium]|nr:hypothetical protein [Candidatus Peregrinibacteria bacterium]MBI3816432.1 hypothetical protein [Candidatus Peregrinibacteria bacterium]